MTNNTQSMQEALEKFVAWNKKYPSSRIYSRDQITCIAKELDVIYAEAIRALSTVQDSEQASTKGTGHRLTEMKTKNIIEHGYKHTGYILTNEKGEIALIDSSAVRLLNNDQISAVRWLNNDQMWNLMHSESSEQAQPVAITDEEILELAAKYFAFKPARFLSIAMATGGTGALIEFARALLSKQGE